MKRIKRLIFRTIYYPVMLFLNIIEMINGDAYKFMSYRFFLFCGIRFSGKPNYISSDVYLDECKLITIGADCVVSKRVVFLTHDYSLTTGLKAIGKTPQVDKMIVDKITLGNNVFVGLGSTLLPGTNIGDNCIIGAGCVVKGVIPSNSVVIGNPAKVICSLSDYANKKLSNWESFNIK